MTKIKLLILMAVFCGPVFGQVSVTNTQTIEWYVQNVLAGTGVTISNVQYNGATANIANPQVGHFTDPTATIGLNDGLILGSGDVNLAAQANISGSATLGGGTGAGVDPDLAAITPNQIFDECVVEFDFVPIGDSIIFSYVFASEEYDEFVCGSVNDAFGFFLTGTNPSGPNYASTNIALIPDPTNPSVFTTTPVSINTVNLGVAGGAGNATNCSNIDPNWVSYNVFYAGSNTTTNYEYDGNTVVLECRAPVNCGETYHIKLAIGDAGDGAYDSGVFLEGGSFSSPLPIVSILPVDENGDIIADGALPENCINASLLMIKPDGYTDSTYVMDLDISGTATNGVDYTQLNSSYTIPPGVDTLEVVVSAFLDALTEGTETLIIGTYFLAPCGDTIDVIDTLNIIDVAPDYNLILQDTILDCPRDSILIEVATDGGIPNIDYDWLTTGETTSSIWVPANVVGTVYYPVEATDFCGITSLDSVQVTLNPSVLPDIVFQDDYILTCVGQNGVDLEATNINNPYHVDSITYDWSPTASTLPTVTVFPNAVLNWYYLTVYDGCNTVTDSVLVEVDQAELDSVVVVQAQGCVGQSATLGSITIYPDDPGWTYTVVGNANTYGPTANNHFDNLAGNITYSVIASDPNGCIADTNIFVPLAISSMNADFIESSLMNITCFGANDGQAEVQNISGGVNSPTPGPFDLVWSHSGGTTIPITNLNTGDGDLINTLFPGNWEVVVTEQGSGCAWSRQFTITQPGLMTLTTNSNEPECYGTSTGSITVFVDGGTQPFSFEITDINGDIKNIANSNTANSLPTGWYFFEATDANGCTKKDSLFLNQPGPLDIDFTVQDILCYGRNTGVIEIDTVYNYSGAYDDIAFYWDPNVSGTTNPIGHMKESQLPPGEYVVEVYSGNCYREFKISVKDTIPIDLQLDISSAFCRTKGYQSGNGEVFGSAMGGAGNFTYEWTNMGTGDKTDVTTWAGLNPGIYQFTAVDNNNCVKSQLIELDSLNPIAAFSLESAEFHGPGKYEGTEDPEFVNLELINESLNFSDPDYELADTLFSINWDSDGENGGDWFFVHDYNLTKVDTAVEGEKEYLVCLVARNFNGCKDTICEVALIHEFPEFTLPNVFTPGTSPNNEFFFPAVGLDEFEAIIFNRYGVEVFRFNSTDERWDGNNQKNGKPCQDGVYFYTYKATSTNGTPFEGQGNITLIRQKD